MTPRGLALHPGGLEIQIVDLRDSPRAVDRQVGLEPALAAPGDRPHHQAAVASLDARDLRGQLDPDAQRPGLRDQQVHQVRIERLQGPIAAVEDGDLRPGPRGDVGELEGDVAAAHEHQPRRQRVQLEELLARRQQLGPGERQGPRHGAGGDQHALAGEALLADREGRRSDEAGAAVEHLHPGPRPGLLGPRGHRIGRRAIEAHERRPVDREPVGAHALAGHAGGGMDGFRRAHEHLLGVAAPLRAGAYEGARVDDRDRPARLPAPRGDRRGHARSHHDQVVCPLHAAPPCSPASVTAGRMSASPTREGISAGRPAGSLRRGRPPRDG